MPKVTKPLTNTEVDKSKPKDKEYTLSILNAVYVVMIFSKMRAVIDEKMAKFTDIEHIITTKGIRVHMLSGLTFSRIIGNNVADCALGITTV